MIHRFVDLLAAVPEPNIVFLTEESSPSSQYVLWKAGFGVTPVRLASTAISSASGSDDFLADTERSPSVTSVLYCRVRRGLNPNQTIIRKVAWDDSSNVSLYTDTGDLDAFGNTYSLQPTWKPDETKVLFRSKGSGTTLDVIKHMDPDGTNVSTLYTSTGGAFVETPYYNHDGTLIAWLELVQNIGFARLRVANADGSSAATIHSETSPASIGSFAWSKTANVIAFQRRASSAFNTTEWSWRKINSDGTGLTTLYSVDRSTVYTAANFDPPAIKWSWLPDASGVVTGIQAVAETGDPWYLTKIKADGTGKTDYSPARNIVGGTPDYRPVVFENGTRIYYADTTVTGEHLDSIALDGSDMRQEFDGDGIGPSGSSVHFHGFKGDTVNI